ncbi:MAG: glycosyltransferase [Candidatus Micrarchaeia archaeon]
MVEEYSDLTILIPTLNEVDNIGKILQVLNSKYKKAKIIVIDDGSSDSTKSVVSNFSKKHANVMLFDRSRERVHGLAISIMEGALKVHTKKIVVIDADMQHPPSKVRELYRKLDHFDIVVGVRSKVENWGIARMLVSKSVAYLAYFIFKLRGKYTCNDMMSGFFGIKADLFKSTVLNNWGSYVHTGYKVLLDTLRIAGPGLKIGEVQYSTFHKRSAGKSKVGFRVALNVVESILR